MKGASGRTRRALSGVGGLVAVIALGGCAEEVYKGPRVVPYTEDSFYVRHLPLRTGSGTVDAMAADLCKSRGQGPAVLRNAYQDVPFSMRYATYDCI